MAPCRDWVALSQEPAVVGEEEEVGQLDGAAVDGGAQGQIVEWSAVTKSGVNRILLLLGQEVLGVQLGQGRGCRRSPTGYRCQAGWCAQGVLLPQGGGVQGRALEHGCGRPFTATSTSAPDWVPTSRRRSRGR